MISTSPPRAVSSVLVWVIVWGTIAFATWDTVVRSGHLVDLSARENISVPSPVPQPSSATGLEHGQHGMVLPAAAADTLHWIMQTQAMVARREWRIRHVDYDNQPEGREVHWAAPFHWWLAMLATLDHVTTGRSMGAAVEHATLVSGWVMFVLFGLGLAQLLKRKLSAAGAGVAALSCIAVYPFYQDFLPGTADHHGIANICCLLLVLFFVIGSTGASGPLRSGNNFRVAAERNDKEAEANSRWFVASALAGGIGLWISAATLVPVLLGLGFGVLVTAWLGRGFSEQIAWLREPRLLRLWAGTGSGVSLAAYLIEYFPANFGLRLEVNHPLYAIAWLGAGELLRVIIVTIKTGFASLSSRERIVGALGFVFVALLPSVIWITRDASFTVLDPFVWRLHSLYISEFQGLRRIFAATPSPWTRLEMITPALLLIPPLWFMLRASSARVGRVYLTLAAIPALTAWIMAWSQVRWVGLAHALSIPFVAVFFCDLEQESLTRRKSLWFAVYGLILVPGLVAAVQRTRLATEFTQEEIRLLAKRDLAQWLRARAGEATVVVAATPTPTTQLIYFGGLAGVGTLYWENSSGLKKTAALFSARSTTSAHEWVQRLGITHIVLFSWDGFEVTQAKLYREIPETVPLPSDAFVAQLLTAVVPPPWLRPLPYRLPNHPALANDRVRIWEVTPEQTTTQATVTAADYYLEAGQPEVARQLEPLLRQSPDLVAAVMWAGIVSRQRDEAAFSAALTEVRRRLSQAPALTFEEHVHLVVVLAVGQQVELARSQLVQCTKKITDRNLRSATPGTLSDLIALSDALGVELPATSRALAQSLLPAGKRN